MSGGDDPHYPIQLTMTNNNQGQKKMLSSKSIAVSGLVALALAPVTGGSSLGIWACHVCVGSAVDAHNESKPMLKQAF